MKNMGLYTLCTLSDGFHWVEVGEDGVLGHLSEYAFETDFEARMDIESRLK